MTATTFVFPCTLDIFDMMKLLLEDRSVNDVTILSADAKGTDGRTDEDIKEILYSDQFRHCNGQTIKVTGFTGHHV